MTPSNRSCFQEKVLIPAEPMVSKDERDGRFLRLSARLCRGAFLYLYLVEVI